MKQSNPKKKIAVIGLKGLPAFGGAAAVGENIIEQLKNKYEFTVLSVASHTEKHNKNYKGVRQIVFRAFGKGGINSLLYYIQSMFYVLFHSYDLIHLHHAESGFITPFLKLKYNLVVTFHGVYRNNDPKFSSLHNAFFRYSEKQNVLHGDKVLSVSKYDVAYIQQKYNKKIDYIPNGICLNTLQTLQKPLQIQEEYILFAAGRIYEIKGLHILLKALKKKKPNYKLIVIGDMNQVPEYKNTIIQLTNNLNVEFLGLIKEKEILFSYIQHSNMFIFPSLSEAMSMMLLEVVAMKVPVIASDIRANTDIFNENEMLFFKSNNEVDLADKMEFAFSNPEIMMEKANNAYQKLIENYTWQTIAKQYEIVYNEI